jgi:membrane protease YdiL (CAAX protease family)
MNLIHALGVTMVLTFLRITVRGILGESYYTNIGDAIASILTLGCTIVISQRFFKKKDIQFFPTNPVNDKTVVFVTSTTIFLYLSSAIIGGFEELFRKGFDAFFKADIVFGWSANMKKYYLDALFVAPVLEELFARGILLQGFLKKYSQATSIVLTTLIFTSLHVGMNDFIEWDFLIADKFFLALNCAFVSWVMIKAGNIKLMIFIHFLWNLLNYVFPLLISLLGIDLTNAPSFFIFSCAVLLISIGMLTRNILRLRSDTVFKSEPPLP